MIFKYLAIIMVLLSFGSGQTLYEENPNQNIDKLTDETMSNYGESIENIDFSHIDKETKEIETASNIMEHGFKFMGSVFSELSGYGMQYGFTHPQYNYAVIVNVVILLLIVVMFSKLVLPILVISYLGYGVARRKIRERNANKNET